MNGFGANFDRRGLKDGTSRVETEIRALAGPDKVALFYLRLG